MKLIDRVLMGLYLSAVVVSADAGEQCGKTYDGSLELQKIKSLAGRWEGQMPMGDKMIPIVVEYRVAGKGSTVIETFSPGSPEEMVSIYYDRDGRLAMTHYCSLGNRPQMILKKSSGDEIHLHYSTSSGINPQKDMHMHGLTLNIVDEHHIRAAWSLFADGKSKMVHTIELTRTS